jgi:hypothetical protein
MNWPGLRGKGSFEVGSWNAEVGIEKNWEGGNIKEVGSWNGKKVRSWEGEKVGERKKVRSWEGEKVGI